MILFNKYLQLAVESCKNIAEYCRVVYFSQANMSWQEREDLNKKTASFLNNPPLLRSHGLEKIGSWNYPALEKSVARISKEMNEPEFSSVVNNYQKYTRCGVDKRSRVISYSQKLAGSREITPEMKEALTAHEIQHTRQNSPFTLLYDVLTAPKFLLSPKEHGKIDMLVDSYVLIGCAHILPEAQKMPLLLVAATALYTLSTVLKYIESHKQEFDADRASVKYAGLEATLKMLSIPYDEVNYPDYLPTLTHPSLAARRKAATTFAERLEREEAAATGKIHT